MAGLKNCLVKECPTCVDFQKYIYMFKLHRYKDGQSWVWIWRVRGNLREEIHTRVYIV